VAKRLPALRPDRIIRALERCGFAVDHQTGSHAFLIKPGLRRPVIVARHRRELPPGTLAEILKQAELSPDEFLEHV